MQIHPHNSPNIHIFLFGISALGSKNNFMVAFIIFGFCLKDPESAEVMMHCFGDMDTCPLGLTFQELLHVLQSHLQTVFESHWIADFIYRESDRNLE